MALCAGQPWVEAFPAGIKLEKAFGLVGSWARAGQTSQKGTFDAGRDGVNQS
jgi:hypothetical protein